jgi:hypothetical protein
LPEQIRKPKLEIRKKSEIRIQRILLRTRLRRTGRRRDAEAQRVETRIDTNEYRVLKVAALKRGRVFSAEGGMGVNHE